MKLKKSQIKELIRHSIRELTSEREDVTESKKRRFTVKEVRMWMKKLEENRYKKVYNSDARRVAWMVNNEGRTLDEMPMSMKKKWSKAQYGRERYLAKEFIKSKLEQMTEGKLTEAISGADRKILFILVREIVRNLKSKIKNMDVNNKSHLNRVGSSILAIIRAMSYSPDNVNYKNFKKYFPKGFNSKLIQKKLKQFHSQNDKVQVTLVTQAIKNELGEGVKEGKLSEKLNLGGAYEKMILKHNDKIAQNALTLVRNKIMKDYKVGKKSPKSSEKVTRRLVATLINNGMKELRNKAKSPGLKKAFQKIINTREAMLKTMKEGKLKEAYRSQSIFFDKKDKSKLEKLLKKHKGKFPFNPSGEPVVNWSLNDRGSKGIEWGSIPKAKYNKAVEFFMKHKLNPRG